MSNLQIVCAEIKAAIAGAGDTPTAKLIAVLEAAGITSPAEIAALIGISERGVRKARPRNSSSGTTVPERNHSSENGTTVPEPQFRDRNHSSESGTTVPPRTRVDDNNKPTYLEDRASKDNPLYPLSVDATFTDENRAALVGNAIVLRDDLRQFWVERFGDDDRLALALVEAVRYVQPNSSKSLEVQVSSQLARTARDKIDRDQRYASAAKPKANGRSAVMDLVLSGAV